MFKRAINFDEPTDRFGVEPWHESISLDCLVEELKECITSFVKLDDAKAVAIAYWILHTYFVLPAETPQFLNCSPILNITSPEKRCGKSTLREIIGELTPRVMSVMNITEASLFRLISTKLCTLFLDEADTFLTRRTELIGILNSGYKRDGVITRQAPPNYEETEEFSTWGAKCIVGIGTLPDTLKSRCITIKLDRKLNSDVVQRKNAVLRNSPNYFIDLRRKIVRFAMESEASLFNQQIELPMELDDRSQDNWEGLLKIASVISPGQFESARNSAIALSAVDDTSETDSIKLFEDLKHIIEGFQSSMISTNTLRQHLIRLDDRPWEKFSKGGISPYEISKLLKPFGIQPKQYKVAGNVHRGYEVSELKSVIERYL